MGTAYKELFKLYDLIQNGETSSIQKFLSDVAAIQVNEIIPSKGISVLHLAVGIEPVEKSRQCTELLLKHGGNPNICNEDGVTPVHIAAIWGRVDNMKCLIGFGGDPSLQDLEGMTAFDYAAREEQWEVYDYLHNVVDLNDDSDDSKCAYTLDLDKILVSTDQIVAEYQYLTEDRTNSTCRKSEMVRDWCESNSLIVNKLYPTILSETYPLDITDDELWNKNITLDLTSNNSYKTCLSKKADSMKISGIHPLDLTSDVTQSESLKRKSVYENFSLPGSPKLVTHKNYNTKSSLRKKSKDLSSENTERSLIPTDNSDFKPTLDQNSIKTKADSLVSDFNKLSFDQSLISSDRSLDKALAVVQNRTNEWLSKDIKESNTRRSSASSGVSSNYSGGSILLANVHEEYKYEDKQEDVVLIEKRLLASPIILPLDESSEGSPDQTMLSIASSLPTTFRYDDTALRAELIKLGFTPGPIQDTTRTLYLKKLHSLTQDRAQVDEERRRMDELRAELIKLDLRPGPIQDSTRTLYLKKLNSLTQDCGKIVGKERKTYSIELEKSIQSDEWMKNLACYEELEKKVRTDFADVNKKWREGKSKTSFTYLLLDPRLTDNLPAKDGVQSRHQMWVTFVNSIFYVGKGKRSRPYAHLYQALTLWKRGFTTSNDKKVQHILDIWKNKVGVVCLHIFQNIIPAEAYTYEAAMIDVIGVNTLKNLKSGTYYGVTESWPHKERRMLGLYLLYKAMQIFINEGERQLRPDDI